MSERTKLSFPRSAWERTPGRSASRPTRKRDATQSVAHLRSHAERGNEESIRRFRLVFLRFSYLSFLCFFCVSVVSPRALAQRDAQVPDPDPEIERKALQVTDGFEVNLFAADPLLAKPIQMNFDAAGRLWVACSEA